MGEGPPERPVGRRHAHLVVPGRGTDLGYRGRAGGRVSKVRSIDDRTGHTTRLKDELSRAHAEAERNAAELPPDVRSDGFTLIVEGWTDEPGYELALKSLDSSGIRLLTVFPDGNGKPERALVWIPYGAEGRFIRKLDQYATDRKNAKLVANIARLRLAILQEFWQDPAPFPDDAETRWWEVWFARLPKAPDPVDELAPVAERLGLRFDERTLAFPERLIALIKGSPEDIGALLTTNCVVAELHGPRLISELIDVDGHTRAELIADLQHRIGPADPSGPAVCLLDTGVNAGHRLLRASMDAVLTALPSTTPADDQGHGTMMAGLSLFGDLEIALGKNAKVRLSHRLESVKVLDPRHITKPDMYGAVMAEASAVIELDAPGRRRAFSLPVSATDGSNDGRPTSWSAALDALSFGTAIAPSRRGIQLIDRPDPSASRLFLVAAGNVYPDDRHPNFVDVCDLTRAQDPSQAWNVVTVGGFTNIVDLPADPMYAGYRPLAPRGEISPHSRTSVSWSTGWPIKPDIVLEAGNLVVNDADEILDASAVNLLTTSRTGDLTEANATSAATAQAARLAALVLDRYPALWPETVRGLLVHSAEWTPAMTAQVEARGIRKRDRVQLLRRYGWGAPTEDRVLASADSDVTLIVEDEFQPFERRNRNVAMRALRMHRLPWPRERLLDLHEAEVRLRVTLSYFVEPNPSNRGWKLYKYPSHQLRFDLKRPTENAQEFQQRVSREAQEEEENRSPRRNRPGPDTRWLVGAEGRSRGSLHSDVWTGTAADLAECGWIAVVPVGGWWKDNARSDRADLPIRYSLLVSLASKVPTDIYTPIANQIGIETPVEI